MRQRHLLFLALFLLVFSLACEIQSPPTWTPSAPQQTAIHQNSTYQAEATATAKVGTMVPTLTHVQGLTATPSPTSTPIARATSGIIEVDHTPVGPIELGTPVNRPPGPGDFEIRSGTFAPFMNWNVRRCPGCDVVDGMIAFFEYPIQGITIEADGSTWLCVRAQRDKYGAEYCGPAVLYRKPGESSSGILIWDES